MKDGKPETRREAQGIAEAALDKFYHAWAPDGDHREFGRDLIILIVAIQAVGEVAVAQAINDGFDGAMQSLEGPHNVGK